MEILQIDVGGKLAHFRKYYANNTAMSFTIPPRTTLMGMLAGCLGRAKDHYYEEFASERIRIGIRVLNPLKKSFHRLNFLSIKSAGDFRGQNGRIQTPFEIVSGLDLRKDQVVYRIYVSCTKDGLSTFEELKDAMLSRRSHYTLTFGTANLHASILNATLFMGTEIRELTVSERIELHSAVPSDAVEELYFDRQSDRNNMQFIEEELLPADFIGNENRELRRMVRVLYSTTGRGISLCVNRPFYEVDGDDGVQRIMFME